MTFNIEKDPPGLYIPKSLELNLFSDGSRLVVVKASSANPHVLRVRSMPLGKETFAEIRKAMDAISDAHVILIPLNPEALNPLRLLIGGLPHYERTFEQAYLQLQVVCYQHISRTGFEDQRVMFRGGRDLPPRIRRAFDRLGSDGYSILGGQQVFAKGRAAQRLATATFLAFKNWPSKSRRRDDLTKELVSVNLVGQAFQSLENLAALFTALKSTANGEYSRFGKAYLTFARSEREYRSASIFQTLDELSGRKAGKIIGTVFQIPLNPHRIKDMGLSGIGIDEHALMRCAQFTLGFMKLSFELLARVLVRKESGRAIKTPQYRVYGAFRHGFAVAIPALDPEHSAIAYKADDFPDDESFEQYVRSADLSGNLLYLDDNGEVTSTHAPLRLGELRQLVKVVYRCGFWLREFTSFAERLYGSTDGKFPYLILASRFLGAEQNAILDERLNVLDG